MLSISVLLVVVILVGQVICGTNKLDVIVSKNCAVWVSISVFIRSTLKSPTKYIFLFSIDIFYINGFNIFSLKTSRFTDGCL